MTTQTTPVYAPVKAIIAEYGLSKSTLHRKLTAWLIKGKKIGRTTLVDVASVLVYLANCPDQ
jgi:hypothetical protein